MVYKPSKKEIKQIENLNRAYKLIEEGIKIVKANISNKDTRIEMLAYKMKNNFESLIKRIRTLLEKQYVDNAFIDIVNFKAPKKKGGRFDKGGRRSKRKKKGKKSKRVRG